MVVLTRRRNKLFLPTGSGRLMRRVSPVGTSVITIFPFFPSKWKKRLLPVPFDIELQVHKPPAMEKAEKVRAPGEQNALETCKIRTAWERWFFASALVFSDCEFFLAQIVFLLM